METKVGIFGFSSATVAILWIITAVAFGAAAALYVTFESRWGLIPHAVGTVTGLIGIISLCSGITWTIEGSGPEIGTVALTIVTAILFAGLCFALHHADD